jgi:response regulator NasT
MRVWLVDERNGIAGPIESLLRQLEALPALGIRLIGVAPYQADFATAMHKLGPDLLDLVVIHEKTWPEEATLDGVTDLNLGVVIITDSERVQRFLPWSSRYPLTFVPQAPTAEALALGLKSASAGRLRDAAWQTQMASLQQRLSDRILVERAKGILVQRLGISEEDAYRRLRLLSRRQRRQIREIAQSLLDTQILFAPDLDGRAPPQGQPPGEVHPEKQ